jgi:hypothetical protein
MISIRLSRYAPIAWHGNYHLLLLLKRNLRDLAMNARIDWTVSWDQVPAKDKGMLYDIVRR